MLDDFNMYSRNLDHAFTYILLYLGHTHDDIDALFGRWSMLLKKENFPTIPALMKSFMDMESIPTIPHLIEEVPNFKSFIEGAIL